jgi:uncharacterized protein (DUF1501 family)
VVQLTGGNDGLNTVIPYTDPRYAKLRPSIGIPKADVIRLNDTLALHPAMKALGKLYDDNALSVIQGVGYPNPSQSHFHSMDIWHTAKTEGKLTEGWLGRACKQQPMAGFHLAESTKEAAPLALTGAPTRVPSLTSLADFQLKLAAQAEAEKAKQKDLLEAAATGGATSEPSLLDFVKRTALNTYDSTEKLARLKAAYSTKVNYPNTPLATRLKLAAQMIDADLGTRFFYVAQDGFDTHAGQGGGTGAHAMLLTTVAEAIAAFYSDLKQHGHAKRVCIMTFSEFGRRAHENGSNGTDHGSAAPMFLVGDRLGSGIVGEHPSLEKLDEGNLIYAIDFRTVYASILNDWLGLDSSTILGKEFKAEKLFKVKS